MARKLIVVFLVVAGLGLIVWAGLTNARARRSHQQAAMPGTPMALAPDTGGAPAAAPDMAPASPLLGKPAPELKLKDTAGHEVLLSSFKGRPMMVNYWATWCGPCKYEIPWIISLRDKYKAQGFEVLGVDLDNIDDDASKVDAPTKAKVLAAVKTLKIDYPVLYGGESEATRYGGVDVLPQSFYIDKTGKVVAVITGAGSAQEAEADVKKAIGAGA